MVYKDDPNEELRKYLAQQENLKSKKSKARRELEEMKKEREELFDQLIEEHVERTNTEDLDDTEASFTAQDGRGNSTTITRSAENIKIRLTRAPESSDTEDEQDYEEVNCIDDEESPCCEIDEELDEDDWSEDDEYDDYDEYDDDEDDYGIDYTHYYSHINFEDWETASMKEYTKGTVTLSGQRKSVAAILAAFTAFINTTGIDFYVPNDDHLEYIDDLKAPNSLEVADGNYITLHLPFLFDAHAPALHGILGDVTGRLNEPDAIEDFISEFAYNADGVYLPERVLEELLSYLVEHPTSIDVDYRSYNDNKGILNHYKDVVSLRSVGGQIVADLHHITLETTRGAEAVNAYSKPTTVKDMMFDISEYSLDQVLHILTSEGFDFEVLDLGDPELVSEIINEVRELVKADESDRLYTFNEFVIDGVLKDVFMQAIETVLEPTPEEEEEDLESKDRSVEEFAKVFARGIADTFNEILKKIR